MRRPPVTDTEFINAWRELQSATAVAKALGISERGARRRRVHVERRHGIQLPMPDPRPAYNKTLVDANRAAVSYEIADGLVLIGSDLHIWPGPVTTMRRAFLKLAKALKPAAIILNGDVADFPRISRFPSIGWEKTPLVKDELAAIKDYLAELEAVAPRARRMWPLGNHDMRFESRIAERAQEMEGVAGVHLKDHFPNWLPCWRVDINDDVVVRHREAGGEHADWNNVLKAGKTIVTGHDHRANVTAYTDYRGTRWGVRCGYMAESQTDPQFVNYLEARMPNWAPAFAVLTFSGGRLLWPELCTKHDEGVVNFRGELLTV